MSTYAADSNLSATTVTNMTVTSTESASGSHLFKLKGYSNTQIPRYMSVESDRFRSGGNCWRIIFFPKRSYPSGVSFDLKLMRGYSIPPDRVIVRFTLLPRDSGGEPLTLTRTFEHDYLRDSINIMDMDRYQFEKYVGDDDSFAVQCEVRTINISVVNDRLDKPDPWRYLIRIICCCFVMTLVGILYRGEFLTDTS